MRVRVRKCYSDFDDFDGQSGRMDCHPSIQCAGSSLEPIEVPNLFYSHKIISNFEFFFLIFFQPSRGFDKAQRCGVVCLANNQERRRRCSVQGYTFFSRTNTNTLILIPSHQRVLEHTPVLYDTLTLPWYSQVYLRVSHVSCSMPRHASVCMKSFAIGRRSTERQVRSLPRSLFLLSLFFLLCTNPFLSLTDTHSLPINTL